MEVDNTGVGSEGRGGDGRGGGFKLVQRTKREIERPGAEKRLTYTLV